MSILNLTLPKTLPVCRATIHDVSPQRGRDNLTQHLELITMLFSAVSAGVAISHAPCCWLTGALPFWPGTDWICIASACLAHVRTYRNDEAIFNVFDLPSWRPWALA